VEARVVAEGQWGQSWLVGRHQAFEFFKPVEDDVDLALLSPLFLDHQESLPVGGDVVV